MILRVLLSLLAIVLSCAASAQSGRAQRGQIFVQTNCAGCHAVGRFGESPLRAFL